METAAVAPEKLLAMVPDCHAQREALQWVEQQRHFLQSASFAAHKLDAYVPVTLGDVVQKNDSDRLRRFWLRRFFLAVLLADWACYADMAHKEPYSHLRRVVGSFPSGFRLWMQMLDDATAVPIGYSGWHPISEARFEQLHREPAKVPGRSALTPLETLHPSENYLYIFNFSTIPQAHKTHVTKALLQTLAADLQNVPQRGLAAVAVSAAGRRIAARFGLVRTGTLLHEGQPEDVFACRTSGGAAR